MYYQLKQFIGRWCIPPSLMVLFKFWIDMHDLAKEGKYFISSQKTSLYLMPSIAPKVRFTDLVGHRKSWNGPISPFKNWNGLSFLYLRNSSLKYSYLIIIWKKLMVHSHSTFLSNPSPIIALPCHSVNAHVEFCSKINFSKLLHDMTC